MEIPDDAIPHFDVAGKLYAYEINDILYMLQVCIIGEAGAGGIDVLTDPHETSTDYDAMENHSIKNVRHLDAQFED